MTRTETAEITSGPADPPRRRILALVGLLALAGALFVPSLFSRDPWHVDELRYAEVSRQMGEYGSPLVPHLNGYVYSEKPPAFFWLGAVLGLVTGDWLVGARLVAALSVTAAALLLVPLGRLFLGSRRAGALSAAVFLTTAMAIARGEQGFIDSLLVFMTTGATAALLFAPGARTRAGRWGLAGLAASLLAAGTLTKGPVGILCPVLAVLAAGPLLRGRKGIAIVPTVAAILVAAGLSYLWLRLAANQAGEWYLDRMLFAQTAHRAVGASAHPEPPTYYLVSILKHLLPWTLILPGALWLVWRRRATAAARGAFAAAAWAAAGLLVFSMFSAKRSGYIFPFYPPLALLLGWALWRHGPVDRFFRHRLPDRLPLAFLGGMSILAGAALALLPPLAPLGPRLLADRHPQVAARLADGLGWSASAAAILAGLGALVAGILAVRALRADRTRATAAAIAGAIGLLVAGLHLSVVPLLDGERSFREVGHVLAREERSDEPYVLLGGLLDGRVNFYTGARRYEWAFPADLEELVDPPGRVRVVAKDRDWALVPPDLSDRFETVYEGPMGDPEWGVHRER